MTYIMNLIACLATGLILAFVTPCPAFDFSSLEPYRGWKPPRASSSREKSGSKSDKSASNNKQVAEFNDKVAAAQAAQRAGNLPEAIELVRAALAIREDSKLRAWLTETEAGLAAYRATEERERKKREMAVQLDTEGLMLLNAQRSREAINKFDEAYSLVRDSVISSHWHLARAQHFLGLSLVDEAIKELEDAVDANPDDQALRNILQQVVSDHAEQKSEIQEAYARTRIMMTSAQANDSSVVDARVAPLGADLLAQVPELERSPAANRILKGYQAVITHDWPVALAWWQEALQRDPNNAALKRSVDLAQWMVDRRKQAVIQKNKSVDPAIAAALKGDPTDAIRMIDQAKKRNEIHDSKAEQMASMIKKQIERRAASAELPMPSSNASSMTQMVTAGNRAWSEEFFEEGLQFLVAHDYEHAEEAFQNADFFRMFDDGKPFQATSEQSNNQKQLEFISK